MAASIARGHRRRHSRSTARSAVGGGCINQGFRLQGGGRDFFVKLNAPPALRHVRGRGGGPAKRSPQPAPCGCHARLRRRAIRIAPGWCSNICRSRSARPQAMATLGEQLARHASRHARALRLDARQHHRLHAAGQHGTARLDRVLAAAPARVPARSGRAQRSRRRAAAQRRATAGAAPEFCSRPSTRGLAAARRSVGRQRRSDRGRRAGDLRPCGATTATAKPIWP